MAGGEDAAAVKKKHSSKRPSGGRPSKDSEGGGGGRRSSGEQKSRRDSGGRNKGESSDEEVGVSPPPPSMKRAVSGSRSPNERARSRSPNTSRNRGKAKSSDLRSRSKSPGKAVTTAATAPKKPMRMGSGISSTATPSLDKAIGAGAGLKRGGREVEEQSLGDFAKYQGKIGNSILGALNAGQQSYAPEESLGSFTGFIKKYEQEELLGIHDKPDAYNPYEQQLKKPKQQLQKPPDASFGDIMNPMKQYGGLNNARQAPVDAEDSLGSFTKFAVKYENDKLLGLQDSELSAPPVPVQKEEPPDIPEESMDVMDLLGGGPSETPKEENSDRKNNYYEDDGIDIGDDFDDDESESDETDESDNETEKEQAVKEPKRASDDNKIELPQSRIEKLRKQGGGLGYKIVVDTPGGHSSEPMKIVVAIEFEDESDSEQDEQENNRKEDPYEVAARLSHQDLYNTQKSEKEGGVLDDSQSKAEVYEDEDDNNDSDLLTGHINRRNQSSGTNLDAARTLNKPSAFPTSLSDRNATAHSRSTSTHSTLSSVTIESSLQITTDGCPSNQNVIQRPPTTMRRPSGATGPIAPHNLGTRKGLLLRQMSEASMKSFMSNDSSWVDPSDVPENYQASFMQLNLLDLNRTQMQSNEEVEQAILPDKLPSGMENIPETEEEEEHDAISDGKEPQVASQELLGMKTMLKHIKRVAPRRSRSFDFDRETPKAVWNSLFARSQKNELPGSQFVDNDESTGHDDEGHDHEMLAGETTAAGTVPTAEGEKGDAPQAKKSGFMSTIFSSTTKPKDKDVQEKIGTKGKSSLWSSMAIKTVIRPKEKNQGHASTDDEASLGSNGNEEEQHENDNLEYEEEDGEEEEEEELEPDEHSDDASDHSEERRKRRHRRKHGERGENSARGARTSLKERPSRRAGPARSRARNTTNMLHQSLSDALDFYSVEQEGSEEEDEVAEVTEFLDAGKDDDDDAPKRKGRARRKLPNRTKSSEESGPPGTRTLPSRTRSSDGLRGPPGRTRSLAADTSPTRPSRTKSGLDDKNALAGRQKAKAMPRRTKSTPEGKERPNRSHDKGMALKHRVDKTKPLVLNKPPVNPHPEVSGHSRALQLPEGATEKELRDLLDYH